MTVCREVAGVVVSLTVLCSSLCAQDVAGVSNQNLSLRGVALEYGYLWADRVINTTSYGVRFDLGYAGTGVRVVPSLMYWTSSMNAGEIVGLKDRVQDLVAEQNDGVRPALDLGRIDFTDIAVGADVHVVWELPMDCLLYTSPSPRDKRQSRMPSSA